MCLRSTYSIYDTYNMYVNLENEKPSKKTKNKLHFFSCFLATTPLKIVQINWNFFTLSE